jgi:peptidyl-prolyl cis-trans isomerase SurA
VIVLAAAAAFAQGGVVDRVAAVVGDEVIALSEIYELAPLEFFAERCPTSEARCITEVELEVLDALLRRALIRRELVRLGMDVTAVDVDQAIDRMVREFGLEDRQALRAQVEATDTRWDQYRDEVLEQLRTRRFQERVLLPRVNIREDEIVAEYNRQSRGAVRPYAKVSAFGIPLDPAAPPEQQAETQRQTELLVTAIREGRVSWDEAVATYDGAGLAPMFSGQEFTQGSLVEAVDAAVFTSEIGAIADPIRVNDVLFVLRVDERGERAAGTRSLEESREDLRNILFQEKIVEAEEEWYQRARREATIDIKLSV